MTVNQEDGLASAIHWRASPVSHSTILCTIARPRQGSARALTASPLCVIARTIMAPPLLTLQDIHLSFGVTALLTGAELMV